MSDTDFNDEKIEWGDDGLNCDELVAVADRRTDNTSDDVDDIFSGDSFSDLSGFSENEKEMTGEYDIDKHSILMGSFNEFSDENEKEMTEKQSVLVESFNKNDESGEWYSSEQSNTDDEFDFDKAWEKRTNDDGLPEIDMSNMDKLEDNDAIVVVAVASGENLVYIAHGTEGKLGYLIKFLRMSLGGRLVTFELGDEDIDTLKNNPVEFRETFKKYVEG